MTKDQTDQITKFATAKSKEYVDEVKALLGPQPDALAKVLAVSAFTVGTVCRLFPKHEFSDTVLSVCQSLVRLNNKLVEREANANDKGHNVH